jgi:Fe2+ transport system protein FeoA
MRRDWGRRRAHGRGRGEWGCARCLSLAQAPVGSWARVINLDSLPANRKLQLQAMGISPGRRALVQQQEPVTIVLCGQAEIALESELAGSVLVELTD